MFKQKLHPVTVSELPPVHPEFVLKELKTIKEQTNKEATSPDRISVNISKWQPHEWLLQYHTFTILLSRLDISPEVEISWNNPNFQIWLKRQMQ